MTTTATPTDTIVLIHGLWMTPFAWEHWVTRYEAQGFTVLTPGYPGSSRVPKAWLHYAKIRPVWPTWRIREVMDHLTEIMTACLRRRSSWGTPLGEPSHSFWWVTAWAWQVCRSTAPA